QKHREPSPPWQARRVTRLSIGRLGQEIEPDKRKGRCPKAPPLLLLAISIAYSSPKLPATGSQCDWPQANSESANPMVLVCRKYHVVLAGRNTAGVSIRSTMPQSPAISLSPGFPKKNSLSAKAVSCPLVK